MQNDTIRHALRHSCHLPGLRHNCHRPGLKYTHLGCGEVLELHVDLATKPPHMASPASSGPNTEGIEVQFGPRLPLPPINPQPTHHFPPRRRPGTKTGGQSSLTLATSTLFKSCMTKLIISLSFFWIF